MGVRFLAAGEGLKEAGGERKFVIQECRPELAKEVFQRLKVLPGSNLQFVEAKARRHTLEGRLYSRGVWIVHCE